MESATHDVYDDGGGVGGAVSRNFQSGPIWLRKWSDMASKVGRYDFMDYHIRPLWKMLMNPFHVLGNSFSAVSTFLYTTVNFISERRVRENWISIVIMLLCYLPPRDYGFNLLP